MLCFFLDAPILSVNPVDRLRARLGTTAAIQCTARANPPVNNLVWIRPGGPMGAGEFTVSRDGAYQFKVEREDAGTLLCRASNSAGENEVAVSVEVLFPPEVRVSMSPMSVRENGVVTLTCDANASPTPSTLRWRRVSDGAILAEVSDSSALVHKLEQVKRADAGKYICEASNTMIYPTAPGFSTKVEYEDGSDQKEIDLKVLYQPGVAVITNGAMVSVAAGESVRLFCHVEDLGNPFGTISWYRLAESDGSSQTRSEVGRSSGSTAELRLENVNAERVAGLYECVAENKFGRGTPAVVTLVVNEQPRWVSPLADNQRPLWTAKDFALTCIVAGNPAPAVTWHRNGHMFVEDGNKAAKQNSIHLPLGYAISHSEPVFKRGLLHVTSVMRFPAQGLNRNDSGLYSCKAENKLGVSSSQTTVSVLYPPVPITGYSKFAANLGRSARLRFLVYSASKPRFYWSMDGKHISNSSDRYYITEKGSTRRELFESVLTINQVTAKDFGMYTIRAENDQGRTGDTVLRLVEPGVPDAPLIFEATPNNWGEVKLTWQPGFDGGSTQTVEIMIFDTEKGDQTPFKVTTVQSPPVPKYLGQDLLNYVFDESNVASSSQVNISGLLPGRRYNMLLRGVNHFGGGPLSEQFSFTTPNLTEPFEVFFNPLTSNLHYKPADSRLCVRVAKTLDSGRTWRWMDECVTARRGMNNLGQWPSDAVAIAMQVCLIDQPGFCTNMVSARPRHFDDTNHELFEALGEDDVSSRGSFISAQALILGIAAGIGATIILLLVSVIVVCQRRRRLHSSSKEGVYSLGTSGRGSSNSSDGIESHSSAKPVLISSGSGGCYAAIDSVVAVQQHSGSASASGVSGSSPLDMSDVVTSHQTAYQSTATFQNSYMPHFNQQGWSTSSGSTESAVLHPVDDSGIVQEDLTAVLRRMCTQNQHQFQPHDANSDKASSNNAPLLSTYGQTPDPSGSQRKVRYEVVV